MLEDKAFARSVNRDDIALSLQRIEAKLDDHIGLVIDALKPVAAGIGIML